MSQPVGFLYVSDSNVEEYVQSLMYSDDTIPNHKNVTYNNAIAFLGSSGQIATKGNIYGGIITFSISNDLKHCSFSNNDTEIKYGLSYSNTITVTEEGYDIVSIKIMMGGIDVTSSVYKDKVITIEKVTGNIYITGVVNDGFAITQNINNCTSSNPVEKVTANTPFVTTITPNEGYNLIGISVLMGGTDITATVYKDNEINIPSVTDDVVITATTSIITFTVSEGVCDGVVCTYDSTIGYGKILTISVTVNDKYTLSSNNISITENDAAKTFIYSDNKIIIENVKGNIIFNIDAAAVYSITYVLNHVNSSNTKTEITDQESYESVLSYTSDIYNSIDVIITMGGNDITLSAYNEDTKTISILNPSGDIIINAEASTTINKKYEEQIDLTSISWKFNKLRDVATETFDETMMSSDYDDSSWIDITLPYDWSIYNSFNSSIEGNEYESGWLAGGDAIYRSKVTIPSEYNGNKIYIHFDGVYMTSEIYINGTSVGTNKNGYIPFDFDVTNYIKYGETNTIAVAVSNHIPSSRWYSGSGIYRKCWLSIVNVPQLGIEDITVTTPNLASEKGGTVTTNVKFVLESVLSNDLTLSEITAKIYQEWDGELVGTQTLTNQTLVSNQENTFNLSVGVNNPTLWTTHDISDTIRLYKVIVSIIFVYEDAQYTIHSNAEIFGYRYISYDSNGFYLNGTKTFLKGMCEHHDNGILGAETYKDAAERKLRILANSGCNCLRTTHAPQSSVFLECAMRHGFMVIEEFFDGWRYAKNENIYDYSRFFNEDDKYIDVVIKNTIKRDKNNPAIIMWSIGNEVDEGTTTKFNEQYVTDATTIINYIKSYDTTRPTTIGNNQPANSYAMQIMALVDIPGVNYGNDNEYSTLRSATSGTTAFSSKCIYGSETVSAFYTRGIYTTDASKQYFSCFDTTNTEVANSHTTWGDAACVSLKRHQTTYNWLAGTMPWTGFDYIGEPTPVNSKWSRSSFFGIVDLVGLIKDPYYMYQSQWTTTPMIHIVPEDWSNYTEGDAITVWVYSNCNNVKLHLNGSEITATTNPTDGQHYAYEYSLTYSKNTLVATGYDTDENIIAQDIRYIASDAYQIGLYSDKLMLSKNGLLYVECDIEDKYCTVIPTAKNKVSFTCEGGNILGTDNGFEGCLEDIRNDVQTCFAGKCVVVVKPNADAEKVIVKATSDGLVSGEFSIKTADENIYKTEEISFIDPVNAPTNSNILYYTIDNNNVHIENGGSAVVNITKYLKQAKNKIKLVSITDGIYADIDNNYNTITISNTIDNIKGNIVIECGGIQQTINVACGTSANVTCSLLLDEKESSDIYEIEYLPVSFEVSEGGVSNVKIIYGSDHISYNSDIALLYGVKEGLGILEVTLSTNDVFYFNINVSIWKDSSDNTLSSDTISSVYSNQYDETTIYSTDTQINGELNLKLFNASATSFIAILDIDPTTTLVSSPTATFGYDSTGTRKSYIFKWGNISSGYLKYWLSIKNSENGLYNLNVRSYKTNVSYTYRIGTLSCNDIILDSSSIMITSDDDNNQPYTYTLVPANTTDSVIATVENNYINVIGHNVFANKNGEDTITITCGSISKTLNVIISNITEDYTLFAHNIKIDQEKSNYVGTNGTSWTSDNTLFAAFRIDTIIPSANVISFGENISAWKGNHYHIYYPSTASANAVSGKIGNFSDTTTAGVCIAMGKGDNMVTAGITTELKGDNNDTIYIAQNANGLWINGYDASTFTNQYGSFSVIQSLTNVYIGSQEGYGRFNGTILELRKIQLSDLADDYSTGLSATELEEISNNGFDKTKYLKTFVESNNDSEISEESSINIAYLMDDELSLSAVADLYAAPISYEYLSNLSINSTIDILLANPHINNGYILGHLNNKTVGYSNDQVSTNIGSGFDSISVMDDQVYSVLNSEYFNNFVYTLTKIGENAYTLVLKDSYSPVGETGMISWSTTPIEFSIDNNILSTTSLSSDFELSKCIRFKNSNNYYLSAQGSPSLAKFTYNNSEWSTWYVYKLN